MTKLSCPNCFTKLKLDDHVKTGIIDYNDYSFKLNTHCFECSTSTVYNLSIRTVYKKCKECQRSFDLDRLRSINVTQSLKHLRLNFFCYSCKQNYSMLFKVNDLLTLKP